MKLIIHMIFYDIPCPLLMKMDITLVLPWIRGITSKKNCILYGLLWIQLQCPGTKIEYSDEFYNAALIAIVD